MVKRHQLMMAMGDAVKVTVARPQLIRPPPQGFNLRRSGQDAPAAHCHGQRNGDQVLLYHPITGMAPKKHQLSTITNIAAKITVKTYQLTMARTPRSQAGKEWPRFASRADISGVTTWLSSARQCGLFSGIA